MNDTPKEDYNYNYTEEPNIQEPPKEVFIEEKPVIEEEKIESVEEENTGNKTPLLTTNPPIEEEKTVIDYEKIINIIKENGINQGGIYVYEFTKDDKMYSINYEENEISIYIMYENVIENIKLFIDVNRYYYQKYIDYNEIEEESELEYLDNNSSIILRINEIFE